MTAPTEPTVPDTEDTEVAAEDTAPEAAE